MIGAKKCGYLGGALCTAQTCDLRPEAGVSQPAGVIQPTADVIQAKITWEEMQLRALGCPHVRWPWRSADERQIHISDVRAFKSCRMRWSFTSPLRRHLEPRAPRKHLWLGRGMHYALAAYYRSNMTSHTLVEAFESWLDRELPEAGIQNENVTEVMLDELMDMADLGTTMLKHYLMWAPKRDNFKVIATEVRIRASLPSIGPDTYFVGMADALVQDNSTKEHWLIEHKTTGRMPDFSLLALDDQSAAYIWGVHNDPKFTLVKPVGVLFNFLLKKKPRIPKTLVSGGIERRMNIATSYEVYRAVLDKLDLSPAPYNAILEHLRTKETFFKRAPRLINAKRRKTFERNLLSVASEMLTEPPIYPAQDWAWFKCRQCPFKTVCTLSLQGADYSSLLRADFKKREMSLTDYNGGEA